MLSDAVRRWVEDVTGAALSQQAALPGATSSIVALLTFGNGTDRLDD